MDPEKVVMFLEGINGQLYLYENRVLIKRMGTIANLTHNLKDWRYYHTKLREKEKTILFYQIERVELRKVVVPLTNGYIRFVTADVKAIKNIYEATQDDNTLMFGLFKQNTAIEIQQHLEDVLSRQ